jgi:hypothetical protein
LHRGVDTWGRLLPNLQATFGHAGHLDPTEGVPGRLVIVLTNPTAHRLEHMLESKPWTVGKHARLGARRLLPSDPSRPGGLASLPVTALFDPEGYVFSDASRSYRFIFVDQATEDIDPANAWRVG